MANFCPAPKILLRKPASFPSFIAQPIKDRLILAGTYDIYDESAYLLKVPYGNTDWKGPQSRLIGVWGGDEAGNRLVVTPRDPIVDVTLVSETPVAPNLWVYLVSALADDPNRACMDRTQLQAKTADGRVYCAPLSVQLLPEYVVRNTTFNGGSRTATAEAIVRECRAQGVTMREQIAYVLATAEHESGFAPLRENWGARTPHTPVGDETWRRERLRYNAASGKDYIYYGRGYVQLTHIGNYQLFGGLLRADMVADPDLMLHPNLALFVLVYGMAHGSFTGASLHRFINAHGTDFVNARRIVNGLDVADGIARIAQRWLTWLGTHPVP